MFPWQNSTFRKGGGIAMSLCTVCGRVMCDHSQEERGQSFEEMMRPLSSEEEEAWQTEPADSPRKIEVAKKHAHDPVR